jgi:hypothetical protein
MKEVKTLVPLPNPNNREHTIPPGYQGTVEGFRAYVGDNNYQFALEHGWLIEEQFEEKTKFNIVDML